MNDSNLDKNLTIQTQIKTDRFHICIIVCNLNENIAKNADTLSCVVFLSAKWHQYRAPKAQQLRYIKKPNRNA